MYLVYLDRGPFAHGSLPVFSAMCLGNVLLVCDFAEIEFSLFVRNFARVKCRILMLSRVHVSSVASVSGLLNIGISVLLRSMARAGLGPSPGWGPVRVGAHMGPYGSSWTGLGRLRKLSVRLLDQFRTFRVQN